MLCTQTPGGVSEDEYVESLLDHGVAGIIFVSGRHADTAADHEPLPRADRPRAAGGVRQRLRPRRGRAVHLRRRRRGDGARRHPPRPARPPPHRPGRRAGAVRAGAAQARRLRAGARPAARHGPEDEAARLDRAVAVHPRGRPGRRREPAARPRRHRDRLRLRPDGARRDPRGPPAPASRARGRLAWSATTTQPAGRLRRPAADHDPPVGAGDGRRRRQRAGRGDRRHAGPHRGVRLPARSWCCAASTAVAPA